MSCTARCSCRQSSPLFTMICEDIQPFKNNIWQMVMYLITEQKYLTPLTSAFQCQHIKIEDLKRTKSRRISLPSQRLVEDSCISHYFDVYIVAGLKEKNDMVRNLIFIKRKSGITSYGLLDKEDQQLQPQ